MKNIFDSKLMKRRISYLKDLDLIGKAQVCKNCKKTHLDKCEKSIGLHNHQPSIMASGGMEHISASDLNIGGKKGKSPLRINQKSKSKKVEKILPMAPIQTPKDMARAVSSSVKPPKEGTSSKPAQNMARPKKGIFSKLFGG